MMFNIDIVLQGNKLNRYRPRATFLEESLREILKSLKLWSPINFKEKNIPQLDDSFRLKQEVILSPD